MHIYNAELEKLKQGDRLKTAFKLNKVDSGWYRYAGHDMTRDLEFGWSIYNGSKKIGHAMTLKTAIKGIDKIVNGIPITWQDSFHLINY